MEISNVIDDVGITPKPDIPGLNGESQEVSPEPKQNISAEDPADNKDIPDPDDPLIREWAEWLYEINTEFSALPADIKEALLTRRIGVSQGKAMLQAFTFRNMAAQLERELELERKKSSELFTAVANTAKNPGPVGGGAAASNDAFSEGFDSI